MQVVVEMLSATAVLREATRAWMALAVVADATDVVAVLVGQKDVGAEIDRLSEAFEPSSSPSQMREIMHRVVDRDEHVGVFRDRLRGGERTDKCDAQDTWNIAGSSHERKQGHKQRPAWLRDSGSWFLISVTHGAKHTHANKVRSMHPDKQTNGRGTHYGQFVPLNEGATRQPVACGERRLAYYRGVV